MKHFALAVILLLGAVAREARASDSGDVCQAPDKRVAALAGRYRELRERRGRLPQGVYDEELQSDGGEFQSVLASLGSELGRPPHTRQTITQCLGEPDAVKKGGQMRPYLEIYKRELRKAGRSTKEKPGRVYLIYHWRGGHDFLFFITEGGRVVDHGWWFAYE